MTQAKNIPENILQLKNIILMFFDKPNLINNSLLDALPVLSGKGMFVFSN